MEVYCFHLLLRGDARAVEPREQLQADQHPQPEEGQLAHRVVLQNQGVQQRHSLQELHLAHGGDGVAPQVQLAQGAALAEAAEQPHAVARQAQPLQPRQLPQVVQVLQPVAAEVQGGQGQRVQPADHADLVPAQRQHLELLALVEAADLADAVAVQVQRAHETVRAEVPQPGDAVVGEVHLVQHAADQRVGVPGQRVLHARVGVEVGRLLQQIPLQVQGDQEREGCKWHWVLDFIIMKINMLQKWKLFDGLQVCEARTRRRELNVAVCKCEGVAAKEAQAPSDVPFCQWKAAHFLAYSLTPLNPLSLKCLDFDGCFFLSPCSFLPYSHCLRPVNSLDFDRCLFPIFFSCPGCHNTWPLPCQPSPCNSLNSDCCFIGIYSSGISST
mmetsp:Transcript_19147/g.30954  ORF Transcript_19147/g.30954 Transcript_19147/m.30954 type:complete len:385 (-) Transcript_19147:69-1223(-)